MSGFRYVLVIGVFAVLAALCLGDDDDDAPARNAGLEHSQLAPIQ